MKTLEEDAYRDWVNVSIFYPEGAHTLTVQAVDRDGNLLGFMTEPVQFEVYRNTRLLWNATYDEDSSEHLVAGRLLWVSCSGDVGLGSKNVMICLDETNVVDCTTDGNGWFVYRRHFDVGETTTT